MNSNKTCGTSRAFTVLLICAMLLPSVALGAQKYSLDLTALAIRDKEAQKASLCRKWSGGGIGSSAPRPELTVALQLQSVDRNIYKLGEEIIVELRLTNVGNYSVSIPWSPYRDTVYSDYCSSVLKKSGTPLLEASLALHFTDKAGIATAVGLHSLYGGLDDPNTYRVLEPHESAKIKVSGMVFFGAGSLNGPADYQFELPQDLAVTAVYELHNSTQPNPYQQTRSANAINVRLEKVASY